MRSKLIVVDLLIFGTQENINTPFNYFYVPTAKTVQNTALIEAATTLFINYPQLPSKFLKPIINSKYALK